MCRNSKIHPLTLFQINLNIQKKTKKRNTSICFLKLTLKRATVENITHVQRNLKKRTLKEQKKRNVSTFLKTIAWKKKVPRLEVQKSQVQQSKKELVCLPKKTRRLNVSERPAKKDNLTFHPRSCFQNL